MEKDKIVPAIFGFFLIILISLSVFFALPMVFPNKSNSSVTFSFAVLNSDNFSKKNFTEFDRKLAIKLMDKDEDGKCDACGMNVELCMDSGQIECNMVPGAKFGVLGSAHIHANFKVFLNGKEFDFGQQKYAVKSRFMHVENDVPEEFGKLLHIHATGMPLWLFFESLGMKLSKDCFELDTGENFCSNSDNSLNFYVNGQPSNEFQDYVPKDKDKILISLYGNETNDIGKQLESITNYS